MDDVDLAARLHRASDSKILFLIADGLGGLPGEHRGSELEEAHTPHLDRLAAAGTTGMLTPVAPGITPGSGPGHLALFGYDPLAYDIGRGVLAALGVGFELQPEDVAARGNFCTVDADGNVTDRRAGRIDSDQGRRLVEKLRQIDIDGVDVFVEPVKQYRFLLVLRGEGLGGGVADTDPYRTGVPPRAPQGRDENSNAAAEAVAAFVDQARRLLSDEEPANMILLRGFDSLPRMPSMGERYGVNACAVAGYPMYRGVARLLGMQVAECGSDFSSQVEALQRLWPQHDFFFLHYKATDSAGEDGDFDAKVAAIEELDAHLPRILELHPDVLVVTGDHSTPARLASHSWHPVPLLISAASARRDDVQRFGETGCARGGLANLAARQLMTVALAHAGRLAKYGA